MTCIGAAPIKTVYISIQGGGWCYDEVDCLGRSLTPLGSTTTWPAKAAGLSCTPQSGIAYVNMWYGDGASFTGFRAAPWPVPGNGSAQLLFRGARNLDSTLDYLFAQHGLAGAELLVVNGGSAGGLSTFLHLDHIAARMAAQGSSAVVRGQPVCGYFLDAGNDGSQPLNVTYPLRMKYVFNMQNSTGSLSPECQAVYGEPFFSPQRPPENRRHSNSPQSAATATQASTRGSALWRRTPPSSSRPRGSPCRAARTHGSLGTLP